jgi:DNA-binding GntR family transcriptional regulator
MPGRGINTLLESSGDRSAPLSEQALVRLRNDILRGMLAPGLQLKLDTLISHYGFSSSPLREALNRLTAEGLVVNEDRRGFFVTQISIPDIQEISRIRSLLEPECLRDSIENGNDVWEAGIISAHYRLDRYESRISSDRPFILDTEWASLHQEFHNSLLAGCNSERLLLMRTTLFYQAERYWHLWANANPKPVTRGSNHTLLRDTVLEREVIHSSNLIKNHILKTTEVVIKYLETK